MATSAAAARIHGDPVVFTVGSDGTVFVNQQQPTNDPNHPLRSAGLVALPGLQASSIAAFQTASVDPEFDNLPEVVATTGSESYIYRNIELPTGDPMKPFAWSGWQAMSGFVARSVVAAQGEIAGTNALFAIGADSNVYENPDEYNETNHFADNFDGFQPIPGLSATSLGVIEGGDGYFHIFALTGPQSFIDQTATYTPGGNVPITTSPWSELAGSFVASSISVSEDPSNVRPNPTPYRPVSVFATGGDGHLYSDILDVVSTQDREGSAFQLVGDVSPLPVPIIASSASLETNGDDSYQTILALGEDGSVYEDQALFDSIYPVSFRFTGWVAIPGQTSASILSTVGPGGGAEVIVRSGDGITDVNEAVAHLSTASNGDPVLNNFLGASDIAAAYHPLAVTSGPTGKPVVATIGNDGTVYVALDTTATSSSTMTDSYSGWTALSGLAATSIAATTEPDGIAVFGLTATGGVYVNQYRPTGDVSQPFAWTGWELIRTYLYLSISAVTAGGSSSNSPTLIIGEGGASTVIVIPSSPPSDRRLGYTFDTTPTILDTTSIKSMSVRATFNGIEIAALTGDASYPEVNLYAPDAPDASDPARSTWSGWHVFGDYVMDRVFATTGLGNTPAIVGNSPLGGQGSSEYLPNVGSSGSSWTSFRPTPTSTNSQATADLGDSFRTLDSIVYKNNLGGAYFDLFGAGSSSVLGYGFTVGLGTDQQFSGNPTVAAIRASTLATTPDFVDPSLFAGGVDGRIYVDQGVSSGNSDDPYSYPSWVALAPLPS